MFFVILGSAQISNLVFSDNSSSHVSYQWPARLDPFSSFMTYPPEKLKLDHKLYLSNNNEEETIREFNRIFSLTMVKHASYIYLNRKESILIFNFLSKQSASVTSLLDLFPKDRQSFIFRGLLSLIKYDILRIQD